MVQLSLSYSKPCPVAGVDGALKKMPNSNNVFENTAGVESARAPRRDIVLRQTFTVRSASVAAGSETDNQTVISDEYGEI